jgi:hypothetical protein
MRLEPVASASGAFLTVTVGSRSNPVVLNLKRLNVKSGIDR